MDYEEMLTEFFCLFKSEINKDIPKGIHTKDFLSLLYHKILYSFGLPLNCGYEDILLDFVNQKNIYPGLIESVIRMLEQKGKEYDRNHKNQEFSVLLKSLNERRPVVIDEMKKYVTSHLNFRLTDKEFNDIENGFRIRWIFSSGQIVDNNGFKRSVDFYLTSVENPMNRKEMNKVVDLILEYLEIIGQYGDKED